MRITDMEYMTTVMKFKISLNKKYAKIDIKKKYGQEIQINGIKHLQIQHSNIYGHSTFRWNNAGFDSIESICIGQKSLYIPPHIG